MNHITQRLIIVLAVILTITSVVYATETTWRHSGFEVYGFDINFTNHNITKVININNVNFTDSLNEPSSYTIYTNGTTTFAKNGTTGTVDYSGTDADAVIQSVATVLQSTNGGLIYIKDGNYPFDTQLWIYKNTTVEASYGTKITASMVGAVIYIHGDYSTWDGGAIIGAGNVSGNYAFLVDGDNNITMSNVYYNNVDIFAYVNNTRGTTILYPKPGDSVGKINNYAYKLVSDVTYDDDLFVISNHEVSTRGKIDIVEKESNDPPSGVGFRCENRGYGDCIYLLNLNNSSGKVLDGANGKAIVVEDYGTDYSVVLNRRGPSGTLALLRLQHYNASDISPFVEFTDVTEGVSKFNVDHNGSTYINGTTNFGAWSTPPTAKETGDYYFNKTSKFPCYYNGSTWNYHNNNTANC